MVAYECGYIIVLAESSRERSKSKELAILFMELIDFQHCQLMSFNKSQVNYHSLGTRKMLKQAVSFSPILLSLSFSIQVITLNYLIV